eukprot:symbB.v1.2.034579.t2/scaffold4480.1/size39184/1
MGVSVSYLLHSVFLELLLKVYTVLFTSEILVQPKVSQTAPTLTSEEKQLPLRGCQVISSKDYVAAGQTLPPTKKVSAIFKEPPAGQQMEYGGSEGLEKYDGSIKGLGSVSSQGGHFGRKPREETSLGLVEDDAWLQKRRCLREGAEVHRQVRQFVQQKVRPGMELLEIAEMVTGEPGIRAGL